MENNLEKSLKKVIEKSLKDLQKISLLSNNDVVIKRILTIRKLFNLIKLNIDSKLNKNELYLQNLELSTSIQLFSIYKILNEFFNKNIDLEPIKLIDIISTNKENMVEEIVSYILFQLSDTKNIIYPLIPPTLIFNDK